MDGEFRRVGVLIGYDQRRFVPRGRVRDSERDAALAPVAIVEDVSDRVILVLRVASHFQ